jgi:acetyl esterase/lipase
MRLFAVRWLIPLTIVAVLLPACGDSTRELFEVTTTVVASEYTQDIWVTGPDDVESDDWGSWPVVYLMHGTGGTGEGLSVMAAELARHGVVVFAPNYRSTEPQYIEQDAECGYRYAMTIAEDYGGDPTNPISVGHSLGATVGLFGGLADDVYGPGGTYDLCYSGTPRTDLIVPIAGCYYEYEGNTFQFDTSPYSNEDAQIVMVAGSDDDVCEAWQSQDAAEALEAAGYDTDLIEVTDGDHANVVFYEIVEGEWIPAPDDPVGDEVVQIILDAIDNSN